MKTVEKQKEIECKLNRNNKMKREYLFIAITLIYLFVPFISSGQVSVTYNCTENQELRDFFLFEKIEYIQLNFSHKDLGNKTYQLSVTEIQYGRMSSHETVIDSRKEYFKTVGDTVLQLSIMSKATEEGKLKTQFKFPKVSSAKEFDTIDSSYSYSLVYIGGTDSVEYGKDFYILVYTLPYEKDKIGYGYIPNVETCGRAVETWGSKLGISHYYVFKMKFDPL